MCHEPGPANISPRQFSLLLYGVYPASTPAAPQLDPQRTQSAGPVRFLIFCSITIFLLASLMTGRRPQYNAGAEWPGIYSTIPIHWNIKSAPASQDRSRVHCGRRHNERYDSTGLFTVTYQLMHCTCTVQCCWSTSDWSDRRLGM
jgi:hypothetical protein